MGILVLSVVLLLAPTVPGSEPAFTVRNTTFVVTNKMPTAAGKIERVEVNRIWYDRHPDGRLDYCVECNRGRIPPAGTLVTLAEVDAMKRAGVYPTAAPGVAAPRSFRRVTSGYNPSHNCPTCGRLQLVVSGFNGDGTHRHTCPVDGTTWSH